MAPETELASGLMMVPGRITTYLVKVYGLDGHRLRFHISRLDEDRTRPVKSRPFVVSIEKLSDKIDVYQVDEVS